VQPRINGDVGSNLYNISLFYRIVQHQEEKGMKCVICQYGETEPVTTTVTLTRDETTVVIRDVPAQICTICGEEYVDAATGKRLSQIAESAVNDGVQVDVRRYKAA
jgi:YgiT-type zinc finger domain-containing protein